MIGERIETNFEDVAVVQAIIGKWDDDLAIPIPDDIAASVGLIDGEEVDLIVTKDGLIIRRFIEPRPQPVAKNLNPTRSC